MIKNLTKKELINKLSTRKVQLVSGKWVTGTGFDWRYFKKKDVLDLYKGSRK